MLPLAAVEKPFSAQNSLPAQASAQENLSARSPSPRPLSPRSGQSYLSDDLRDTSG